MHLAGKNEIEERHIQILKTIFKGSKFEILDVKLRKVNPNLVIAKIIWRLDGFRNPGSDLNKPGGIREGVFIQVFIRTENRWKITASQNTLKPQP